jgi:hypothetical protein
VIELNDDGNVTEVEWTDVPVRVQGSGVLQMPAEPIDNLTIEDGSDIRAKNMSLGKVFEMEGNANCSADENDQIKVSNGQTKMKFTSRGPALPRLDLGNIGSTYNILPASLQVDITEERIPENERSNYTRELIRGTTLSNCEQWITIIANTPNHFTFYCENVSPAYLLAGETRALKIKYQPTEASAPATQEESPPPDGDDGLGAGAIAGIAIAAVVVVVAIVGGIIYVKKKKTNSKNPSSSSSASASDSSETGERKTARVAL